MGSKSDAYEVDILKAATGQATTIITTTPLAHVYLALYTVTPSDSAAGTEVSTTSTAYARLDTVGKWATPVSGAGTVTNSADIVFATATGSWGTVVAAALITTASGAGSITYWGALTVSKTVATGDALSFPAGSLVLTED